MARRMHLNQQGHQGPEGAAIHAPLPVHLRELEDLLPAHGLCSSVN